MDNVEIKLENFTGKSSKTGNEFHCFKLYIGDYETLLFPSSPMERNYLQKLIDENAF